MSTQTRRSWPTVGSLWPHWNDLFLATQLAALRTGFGEVERVWIADEPSRLRIRCAAKWTSDRYPALWCDGVEAVAVDAEDPTGAWTVVDAPNFDRKTESAGWQDAVDELKAEAAKVLNLRAGSESAPGAGLRRLEGSLRSLARRDGRFLKCAHLEDDPTFSCVLDSCDFVVRLERLNEVGIISSQCMEWRCVEIRSEHTCESSAAQPHDDLQASMSFFPFVQFQDGCTAEVAAEARRRDRDLLTLPIEKHLGTFPVQAAKSSSAKCAEVVDRCASLFAAESAFSQAVDAIEQLESDVNDAQRRLEAGRELVEAWRRRVEKQRKKLRREVKDVHRELNGGCRKNTGKKRSHNHLPAPKEQGAESGSGSGSVAIAAEQT